MRSSLGGLQSPTIESTNLTEIGSTILFLDWVGFSLIGVYVLYSNIAHSSTSVFHHCISHCRPLRCLSFGSQCPCWLYSLSLVWSRPIVTWQRMGWLGNNPVGLPVLELRLPPVARRRVVFLDQSVVKIRYVTYRTVEAMHIMWQAVQTAPTQIRSVTTFAVSLPYLGAL
jgi:hypothetical protein